MGKYLRLQRHEPDSAPLSPEEIAAYEEADRLFQQELEEAKASRDEVRISQVLEDNK